MTKLRIFCSCVFLAVSFAGNTHSESNCQPRKKEVPVLCYHNIRLSASGHDPNYTVSRSVLISQLGTLADSGYTAILPAQLQNYLLYDSSLPPKPVLISFDDSHVEHFTMAAPALAQYGLKAVFFILSVTIGKEGYLNRSQIKTLSDSGHAIGAHTYDHPDVRHLQTADWNRQLTTPLKTLSMISGQSVECFAYPYGLWDDSAIVHLEKAGISTAFQLGGPRNIKKPQYTIRRILVSGTWSGAELDIKIKSSFR